MTETSIAQSNASPHKKKSNGTIDNMKSNPTEEDMSGMETGAKGASKAEHAAAGAHSSPKKRRKVNHGKKSSVVMRLLAGFSW